jgi:antitoxin component YwqK of YwqJK toxin-antitoxin module
MNNGINDSSKRNSNWVWVTDLDNENGRWVKYGKRENKTQDFRFSLFFDNGNICQKGKVRNGEYIDTIYNYDLSGKIVSTTIRNGKNDDVIFYKQDSIKTYHNNGQVNTIGFVEDSILKGYWKSFSRNGLIDSEGNRSAYNSTGWVKYYYESGMPKDSGAFINGKQHGMCKSWFKNGKVESIVEYSNGKKHGIFKRWYQNGNLEEVVNYKNDTLHGNFTLFYNNGNIYVSTFYKKGRRKGLYQTFYSNGKIVISGNYKNGVKDGKWYFYTINNEVYKTDIMLNGNLLSSNFVKELTEEEENSIIKFSNYTKNN